MPAPDVRQYVDLTLDERDPQQLYEQARDAILTSMPSWVPREGHIETVLLEALALQVWEVIAAVNRVPGAVADVLLRLYGITRSEGTPPTTTVTFTLSDTIGHVVPAGTRVRLALADEDVLDLTTDLALNVAAGSNTGTVAATAVEPTARANGTPAGTALEVVDAIAFVERATLATGLTGGTDPETSEAWRNRAAQRLSRLVTTLVLPSHFSANALEDTRVTRATTVDNYDPAQAGGPGSHPGHVTTYVAASGGTLLSAAVRDELRADAASKALANLGVHVADPTVSLVDVSATVTRYADWTGTDVVTNVTAALNDYLSPDTWPWSNVVRRNELIAIVDRAAGVDYVSDLTLALAGGVQGTGNVTLPGVANLADLGTATVVVNAP